MPNMDYPWRCCTDSDHFYARWTVFSTVVLAGFALPLYNANRVHRVPEHLINPAFFEEQLLTHVRGPRRVPRAASTERPERRARAEGGIPSRRKRAT